MKVGSQIWRGRSARPSHAVLRRWCSSGSRDGETGRADTAGAAGADGSDKKDPKDGLDEKSALAEGPSAGAPGDKAHDGAAGAGGRSAEEGAQADGSGSQKSTSLYEKLRQTNATHKAKTDSVFRDFQTEIWKDARKNSGESDLLKWSQTLFPSSSDEQEQKKPETFDPLLFVQSAEGDDPFQSVPDDPMFAEENTTEVGSEMLEQMITVYELLQDYKNNDYDSFRMVKNPLVEELDFPVTKLPKLPQSILEAYKQEMPLEKASQVPLLGQRLNPFAADTLPSDYKSWNKVDEATADDQMRGRVFGRTAVEDRPDRMTTSNIMNPKQEFQLKPKCRLTELSRPGKIDIDFRQAGYLSEFITDMGKIMHRRQTHLTRKAQTKVRFAVKAARFMALLHHKTKIDLPQTPDKASRTLVLEAIDELRAELAEKSRLAKKAEKKAGKVAGRKARSKS